MDKRTNPRLRSSVVALAPIAVAAITPVVIAAVAVAVAVIVDSGAVLAAPAPPPKPSPPAAAPATPSPPRPTARDKCPVCGMFVSKYPEWTATVVFRDGGAVHFDGAKDLLRYLLEPGRYTKGRAAADVARTFVTDYYTVRPTDAREAWFVEGSDVLGPMGRELIPFARKADAEEFMTDHHGRRLLRLGEIDRALLGELE